MAKSSDARPGDDYLITGHEPFGIVEEVGSSVKELKVGDYVVATVRRPGKSIYDLIGTYDMTTNDTYFERGINLRHGYLTEYFVADAEYVGKWETVKQQTAACISYDFPSLERVRSDIGGTAFITSDFPRIDFLKKQISCEVKNVRIEKTNSRRYPLWSFSRHVDSGLSIVCAGNQSSAAISLGAGETR